MQLNEILRIEHPIGIPLPPKPMEDQIKEKQPLPWIREPNYGKTIEIKEPGMDDYVTMVLNRGQPPNYSDLKLPDFKYPHAPLPWDHWMIQ